MIFVLVGEVIKKEFRTSRNGNEYSSFTILDCENKEYDMIGFSAVTKILKELPEHSKIMVEGKIESEPKTTSSGGRFINLKLISEKISEIKFSNSTEKLSQNFEQIDNENIPF